MEKHLRYRAFLPKGEPKYLLKRLIYGICLPVIQTEQLILLTNQLVGGWGGGGNWVVCKASRLITNKTKGPHFLWMRVGGPGNFRTLIRSQASECAIHLPSISLLPKVFTEKLMI